MLKRYKNKLEMKEIWKQVKGSSVIREWKYILKHLLSLFWLYNIMQSEKR